MSATTIAVDLMWLVAFTAAILLAQTIDFIRRRRARDAAVLALQDAEAKYRGIFENSVEGIFQTTPHGKYLNANPALARIYGYDSPDELIHGIGDIERQLYVHPQRRAEFARRIAREGVVTGFESQVYRRDGSIIWISETARVVRTSQGQVDRYEGTVIDITERKTLESWQREKEAADAANHAKSAFLARMSHEIRTPLNGVIGMIDLLSATPLSAKQEHHVRIARTSAGVLLSLINDLLDFSKIEAGRLELENVEFDLQSLVEDVVEMFGHQAELRRVELACHVLADVPRIVRGDPERLRQILINLVNNALKFTESGSVTIRVTRDPAAPEIGGIHFAIRDTGIGIPAARRGKLFHEFTQVDASTSRKYGGTGLGLAICKQLVELMRGEIGVESEVGRGSVFWFRIPLVGVENRPAAADPVPSALARLRILVVDDNLANLEILRDQLANWNFRTTMVREPGRVLEELHQAHISGDPYRLVILDHQMPVLDGFELAKAIHRDAALGRTVLMMLTSAENPLTADERTEAGLVSCISKPIRQSRLFDAIVDAMHPRTPPAVARQVRATPAAAPAPSRGRALLAEDNEINQIVAAEMLRAAGWTVDIAANGLAAVEAVQRTAYDIVLMDCQMPELDGFEASRAIRRLEAGGRLKEQRVATLPIIAVTANASTQDRDRCLAVGMSAFATKPIVAEQLLNTIAGCLTGTGGQAEETGPAAVNDSLSACPMSVPIDLIELQERCAGDFQFATQLLRKFETRLNPAIDEIRQAVAAGDRDQVRRLAHSLKGSAGNLSAVELSAAAAGLEDWARDGADEDPAARLLQLVEESERCLAFFEEAAVTWS